ncbi:MULTISPECIES: ABC transporter substrate-binding protein [unclassified Actinomadura]|uniref:ABC transporter substrate-binding protein n=1 Tax=unclassified Actinomadura TaxID=2626254 RepID=UPI00190F8850|nr:ABC transporter substrate-binding protein [Actinomadura sp. K4S16]
MSRPRVALAVLAVAASSIAGCSSGSDAAVGKTVTLSFLSYNYGTADLGGKGTQELIDSFEKANPSIKIEPQGVAVADVLTKLRTSSLSGNGFDVAQIGWSKMAQAYQSLPITPVQEIATAQDWRQTSAGFNQAVLAATRHKGVTAAMPYTMSVPALFYNADLFRSAGLDPAKPPTTMAEMKSAALKIVKKGAEGVYVDAAGAGKSDFLTQSLVNSNGGSLVDADGKVTLDQPPAVQAMRTLADLTQSGAQPGVSEADAIAAFKAGKLGMLVTSTAVLAALDAAASGKFEVQATGFPGFGTGPARPTYSGAGLAVLSKDPAKQRAAWTFVKFLTSEQAFTTITAKIGYLPLRPATVTDPRYLKSYFDKDKRLLPTLAQLDHLMPYTSFSGPKAQQAVLTLQDEAVAPIMLRGANAQQTMQATAKTIRGLVGQ